MVRHNVTRNGTNKKKNELKILWTTSIVTSWGGGGASCRRQEAGQLLEAVKRLAYGEA
jgi:hypothetical protein